jgi:Protein of unknown function (DUF416)
MRSEELNSIDDYERSLSTTLKQWSPEQRLAFVAAMAERWLPVYVKFSEAEEWGDPRGLRRILEAVWGHLGGRALAPADRARYRKQALDATPHMDDFDAYDALLTCEILDLALECCHTEDTVGIAAKAAVAGMEAAVQDWPLDPTAQLRVWRQIGARKELGKQLALVEKIGSIKHFESRTIQDLRSGLGSPASAGEPAPRTEPDTSAATGTNQAAFERYRKQLEPHLKKAPQVVPPGAGSMIAIYRVAEWQSRYAQRRDTIDGKNGSLTDVHAARALGARQRARDAETKEVPQWEPDVRSMVSLCLRNGQSMSQIEAGSLEELHAYGPSLRHLWAEAKRLGRSDAEAWDHIMAWARHRPAAWDREDQRKLNGLMYDMPGLAELLARELSWSETDDVNHPWATDVDGKRWQVRINDFPDDLMYSLVIDGASVGDFHDWPGSWHRG